jgi:acetyl esterase/lipase
MKILPLFVFLMMTTLVHAQRSETLDLYDGKAPNTKRLLDKDEIGEGGRVQKVAKPQITVYHPDPDKATGKSILICPGGGYRIIAIQHEGHEIAQWYSQQGILAVVLKYRLPDPELVENPWDIPLDDAKVAIQKIRSKAENWNINVDQVGVLGFSAGGHLAASLSVHGKPSSDPSQNSRPDFSILIYPVISMDPTFTHQVSRSTLLGQKMDSEYELFYSTEKQINADTPPAFLVHSWDDTAVPAQNSIVYAQALSENKVKTEMHLFERGGHGYGRGDAQKHGNVSEWLALSLRWIMEL